MRYIFSNQIMTKETNKAVEEFKELLKEAREKNNAGKIRLAKIQRIDNNKLRKISELAVATTGAEIQVGMYGHRTTAKSRKKKKKKRDKRAPNGCPNN